MSRIRLSYTRFHQKSGWPIKFCFASSHHRIIEIGLNQNRVWEEVLSDSLMDSSTGTTSKKKTTIDDRRSRGDRGRYKLMQSGLRPPFRPRWQYKQPITLNVENARRSNFISRGLRIIVTRLRLLLRLYCCSLWSARWDRRTVETLTDLMAGRGKKKGTKTLPLCVCIIQNRIQNIKTHSALEHSLLWLDTRLVVVSTTTTKERVYIYQMAPPNDNRLTISNHQGYFKRKKKHRMDDLLFTFPLKRCLPSRIRDYLELRDSKVGQIRLLQLIKRQPKKKKRDTTRDK